MGNVWREEEGKEGGGGEVAMGLVMHTSDLL